MKTRPNGISDEPRDPCECVDGGCPEHSGTRCYQVATATLYRVDQTDETGTRFCETCASDAYKSGLYDEASDYREVTS